MRPIQPSCFVTQHTTNVVVANKHVGSVVVDHKPNFRYVVVSCTFVAVTRNINKREIGFET